MSEELLAESLQESVLAVLAFDDRHGSLISAQVVPEHFDGAYRDIAAAVLAYRRRYNKAPGDVHLESLFSRAKLDPGGRQTHALRRTLVNLAAQAESVNGEYVVNRTQDFVRSQKLKGALLQANERYMQGGDDAVPEVEALLHTALRFRQTTLDAGTFLNEVGKSSVFSTREERVHTLGIPELDRYNLAPAPKRLFLYIAPKNTGKSWACVHVGKQSLIEKEKVLHVTLEMDEQEVLGRYYQSFFGISTIPESFTKTTLEFDELERLINFKSRKAKAKISFTDPSIKKTLRKKVEAWNSRFKRLVIKEFPSGTLTMVALRGYLDYLELVHKFVPTMLIVDYPDLFKIDMRDFRQSLGRIFVDLRGLGAERNMAVFAPTQSGRDSIGAKRVGSKNVTEDISKVFTADTVVSYSQTEAESRLGLARLSVEHARHAPKGMQVLITQAYATGQFVLQSAPLNNAYWDRLEASAGSDALPRGEGD